MADLTPVVLTERETQVVRAVVLAGGRKHAAHMLKVHPSTIRDNLGRAFVRARRTGREVWTLTDLLMALGWLRVPA